MSPIYTIKLIDQDAIYVTEYLYDAIDFVWKKFLESFKEDCPGLDPENIYSEDYLNQIRNDLEDFLFIEDFAYITEGVII